MTLSLTPHFLSPFREMKNQEQGQQKQALEDGRTHMPYILSPYVLFDHNHK